MNNRFNNQMPNNQFNYGFRPVMPNNQMGMAPHYG